MTDTKDEAFCLDDLGGYPLATQPLTLSPKDEAFCSDDWETPDPVAEYLAGLVADFDLVLEPACGSGQIVKYLTNPAVVAIDPNASRLHKLATSGRRRENQTLSVTCGDFLTYNPVNKIPAIATNPPFSKVIEFLTHSFEILARDDSARVVFLLPGDCFQSQKRYKGLMSTDCHVVHSHRIVGRVPYIRDGVPVKGRQICDTIYEFAWGKANGETFVKLDF